MFNIITYPRLHALRLAHLQYLDAKDLEVYLKAFLKNRALLVQDSNYIKVFHQQHIAAASAKSVLPRNYISLLTH